MTIEHVRRGIEYDAIKALHALVNDDENPWPHEIASCGREHFEKFAYICADEAPDEVLAHVHAIARKIVETAQTLVGGEKYCVLEEQIEGALRDEVAAFERYFLRQQNTGPKI
jgi:hypothetical protein